MEIGLGLPNAVPGTTARTLLEWATAGEAAGFSALATTDRLVYQSHDALTALAAAAAVTARPRLTTAVLVAPLQSNSALLAKQTATIDRISGGRLTLGLAVGARPDDFKASGVEHAGRGKRFDAQLDELAAVWRGERRGFAGGIGPGPEQQDGPPLILGGHSPAAIARAARRGAGWIGGTGGPDVFRGGAAAFRAAWEKEGREGTPRILALAYYALGDTAEQDAGAYLRDYYGFAPPFADLAVRGAAVGEEGLKRVTAGYEEAGCDELILFPCNSDPRQLDLLAEAAL
ncbi:LLM class flavin-dependent oxidoreductase [Streptomyces sp. NPDC002851]